MWPEVRRERLTRRHQRREHDEHERREERDRDCDQHAVLRDCEQEALTTHVRRQATTYEGRGGSGGRHRGTAWCTHLRELRTMTSVTANETTSSSIAIADA